ncbi:NRPS protein [Oleoguttula sp. CCFEE 5521]
MLKQSVIDDFGGSDSAEGILWGMYGPTEAAIHCTLQDAFAQGMPVGNIGAPLQTVSAFIIRPAALDGSQTDQIEILPLGEEGELALGGHQLAAGYLNRERETRAAFVTHPMYGRLYRTGDRARFDGADRLICSGRISSGQVKLRGQRVELGEVEYAASQAPHCRGAVADVVEGSLVVFYASHSKDVSERDVLTACRMWLPSHTMPSHVHIVASLPYMSSGKADKRALVARHKQILQDAHAGESRGVDDEMLRQVLACITSVVIDIATVIGEILGVDLLTLSSSSAVSLDSLTSIRAASLLRRAGYPPVNATEIMQARTVDDIRHCLRSIPQHPASCGTAASSRRTVKLLDEFAATNLSPERRDDVEALYHCTATQLGMLAQTSRDPQSYCNWVELRIVAKVGIQEVQKAVNAIIAQHALLRAGFVAYEDSQSPYLMVVWKSNTSTCMVPRLDHDFRIDDMETLARPRPIQLCAHQDGVHVLLQLHHALYDQWSIDVVRADLASIFAGEALLANPSFTAFADHASFPVNIDNTDGMSFFWEKHLRTAESTLLPHLSGLKCERTLKRTQWTPTTASTSRIKNITTALGASPHALYQAAFAYLLAAYVGTSDVLYGSVFSGRDAPVQDIDRIFGPCLSVLPSRVDLSQVRTCAELLRLLQDRSRDMLRHSSTSLSTIQASSSTSAGDIIMFDTLFVWQESTIDDSPGVVEVDSADYHEYSLVLEVKPGVGGPSLRITYLESRISRDQVRILTAQINSVVDYMVSNPEGLVVDIGNQIPDNLLSVHNAPPSTHSCSQGLVGYLSEVAARHPSKTALVFGKSMHSAAQTLASMTYGELHLRADRMAFRLVSLGVKPNDLVCICMAKTITLYVSILAVLKAGAGYLPLLPDTPAERFKSIVAQSQPRVCLHDACGAPLAQAIATSTSVLNADAFDLISAVPFSPTLPYGGSDAAYAIFTSGTTGEPKGLIVTQDNLLSNLSALADMYPLDPEDRLLQACSQAFDVSVFEIFFAWYKGMTLCFADRDELFIDIEGAIRTLDITALSLTPTVAALIDPTNVPKVHFLVTAGEPMTHLVHQRWASRGLFQGYGPSETTNICTVNPDMHVSDVINNIGCPFPNTSAFVVRIGAPFEILPCGAHGELVFGGEQVFRGYIGRPDLTEEAVIDHPLYGRLYRSGDIGRMLRDGSLLISGRLDDQVKIRGNRVELGEIASSFLRFDFVHDCTAWVSGNDTSTQQLIAYWVPTRCAASGKVIVAISEEIRVETATLFQELGAALPLYMIPDIIVPCATLPRSAQGKLDRRALHDIIEQLSADEKAAYTRHSDEATGESANWTSAETTLAVILRDVDPRLGDIGRSQSFFTVGLNSITAIVFARAISLSTGKQITPASILRHSSFSRLARLLDQMPWKTDPARHSVQRTYFTEATITRLEERCRSMGNIAAIYPCTPLQSAMLAAASGSLGTAYCNSTTFKVHVDLARLKACFQTMVQRHEMLRTRFVETDDHVEPFAQVIYEKLDLYWIEYPRQSDINGTGTSENGPPKITASRPFSVVAEFTDREVLTTLYMHHAMYDGTALAIFLEEVEALFQHVALTPAPTMLTFIDEVKRHAEPEAMEYWNKRVEAFEPKPFPVLVDEPPGASSHVTRKLGVTQTELTSFCTKHEISHLSLVQAAWAKVLCRAQRSDTVCFGDVVSGRSVQINGVGRLLAPCFNTLPVLAELGIARNNAALLRSLQDQRLEAEPYQLAPLRRIQAASLSPSRHLFDSLLILQPPARPLDGTVWEMRGETGVIDVPLVVEVLQQKSEWTIVVHYQSQYLRSESACALANAFAASLQCCICYPGGDVRSIAGFDTSAVDGTLVTERSPEATETVQIVATNGEDAIAWTREETLVRQTLATTANVPQISITRDTSLYRLGLDSLNAVSVASRLRSSGLQVSATDVMEYRTPAAIAKAARASPKTANAVADGLDLEAYDRQHRGGLLRSFGLRNKDIERVRPATFVQAALLSQSIQSNGQLYVNHITYDIPDGITDEHLRKGLTAVQSKHSVLRMGFCETGDPRRPFAALVYNAEAVTVPFLKDSESQTAAESSREMIKQLHRPLWTAAIHCNHNTNQLRISVHHALYDADSLDLLLADLMQAVQGQDLGPPTNIDHILRSTLEGENIDGKAFWSRALESSSLSPFPNLHPCITDDYGVSTSLHTSQLSRTELERLCHTRSCTIQAAGQAAWAVVLAAYLGETNVTFGTVYSTRSAAQHKGIMFPALSTMPVVCDTAESSTAIFEGMVDYNASMQRYRFTSMTEMQRYADRNLLFDTVFVYQKSSKRSAGMGTAWSIVDQTSAVDYAVSMELQARPDGRLQLGVTTRNDIVPPAHARLILEQYDHVLSEMLSGDSPSHTLHTERVHSITPAKEPKLPTDVVLLHQWVERGAALHPEKVALHFVQDFEGTAFSHRTWTYAQLDDRANQVAQLIRAHGVRSGSIVALCTEKCPDAAWAFVGILKAGCAFLPIDPELPVARKQFIMRDSTAQLMLTIGDLRDKMPSEPRLVDISNSTLDAFSTSKVDISVLSGEVLCYCLYTSGTTGEPKGVEITHGSVIQFILSFHRMFAGRWNRESRWLQFASYWFDVSVLEHFWSWSVGIAVVGAPRDLILDDLSGFIQKLHITHLDLTPSLARLLEPEDVPSLHKGVFITGGESLRPDIIQKWGPYRTVMNGFGPTECTIGVTMNPFVGPEAKPSNIGPQFANVGTYVMGPGTTNPVLRGAVGELCISGILVGKGYLGRPALTAKQFPTLQNGDRIYRTGDLVRQLADGSFSFIGRQDSQVKLRGQRLDLGEIDVTLRLCSPQNIEAASVVVKAMDRQTLVAFIAGRTKSSSENLVADDSQDARDTVNAAVKMCKSRLPGYMVPTEIIHLHHIPLTVNNKVDVKRLTTFFNEHHSTAAQCGSSDTRDDTPLTEEGRRICSVLGRLMATSTGSWTGSTNIFSVGLSSISAIAFATALRRDGFDAASVAVIMRNPQIDELTRAVSGSSVNQEHNAAVRQAQLSIVACDRRYRATCARRLSIPVDKIETVAPCTPLQEGLLLESLRRSDRPYFNHFSYKVGHLDGSRLRSAWQSVSEHVQILRTKFIGTDDGYVQAVLHSAEVSWHSAKITQHLDEAVDRYRSAWVARNEGDLVSPFELSATNTSSGVVLTVYIHHALYDGIAMDLLLDKVARRYAGDDDLDFGLKFTDVLPFGPLFDVPGSKDFWRRQLYQAVPRSLPLCENSPSEEVHVVTRSFGDRVTLTELCRRLQVSSAAIAQTCFALALHQFAPKTTIYGTVVSGRNVALNDGDRTIGPMFNTIPSQLRLQANDTWGNVAKHAQHVSAATVPYQHTSLRAIRKWCGFASAEPLFDVLFVFNADDASTRVKLTNFWQSVDEPPTAEYPLAVEVELDASGEFQVTAIAQGRIASETSLQTLLFEFGRALDLICRDEHRHVSDDFGVMTVAESQKLDPALVKESDLNGVHNFTWTTAASQLRHEIACLAQIDDNNVEEHSTIFALGLDSIDAVKLVSRLKKVGVTISVSEVLRAQTIPRILRYTQQRPHTAQISTPPSKLKSLEVDLLTDLRLLSGISPGNIERILPCTPSQEGLLAEMLRSNLHEYYNYDVLHLSTGIDVQRLLAAWQTVYDQSPILRTMFVPVESPDIDVVFAQMIRKPGEAHVRQVKLSEISEVSDTLDGIRRDVQATISSREPTRMTLVSTKSDKYLILSLAHAQYDGHSLALLHANLRDAYLGQALSARHLADEIIEASLNAISDGAVSYWRGALYGAAPSIFPRSSTAEVLQKQVHRTQRVAEMSAQHARGFCQKQGISFQSLAQTCWALTLAHYTRRLEVVFGVVLACRDTEEADDVMFPTMNTVVMRGALHGTRRDVLHQIQNAATELLPYARTPLRTIQAAHATSCSPDTSSRALPLFDTLFLYQKRPAPTNETPETLLYTSVRSSAVIEYPIAVEMEVVDDEVHFRAACKAEVLDQRGSEQLLVAMNDVLSRIVNEPNKPTVTFTGSGVSICGLPTVTLREDEEMPRASLQQERVREEKSGNSTHSLAIREVFAQVSKVSVADIKGTATLDRIGIDSISAIKVASLLKKQNIHITVSELLRARRVDRIAEIAYEKETTPPENAVSSTAIVSQYLKHHVGDNIPELAGIDAADIESVLPALPVQLYMLQIWGRSRGTLFNPTFTYKLHGNVSEVIMQAAWEQLIVEHPIFRTVFVSTNNTEVPLVQVVFRTADNAITFEDEVLTAEVAQPLMHLHAQKVEEVWELRLSIHHALYDAVSLPGLISDFGTLLRGSSLAPKTVTQEDFVALAVTDEAQRSRQAFWTTYLRRIKQRQIAERTTLGTHGRVEIFQPALISSTNNLATLARDNDISIQSSFFATCAKVYAGLGQGVSGGEDVVLGIYLANRSHLDNLSSLRAPTLNLVPLAIRSAGSRSLLELAKQIHRDLQEIGTAVNSAVALWEIEKWTAVTVDCFVNFLKLPDAEEDSSGDVDIKLEEANDGRLEQRAGLISRPGSDRFTMPAQLQGLPGMRAYKVRLHSCSTSDYVTDFSQHSLDIEASVRDGALHMGIFCPDALLDLEEAQAFVGGVRESLHGLIET